MTMTVAPEQIDRIVWNQHQDPFEVLGPHKLEFSTGKNVIFQWKEFEISEDQFNLSEVYAIFPQVPLYCTHIPLPKKNNTPPSRSAKSQRPQQVLDTSRPCDKTSMQTGPTRSNFWRPGL